MSPYELNDVSSLRYYSEGVVVEKEHGGIITVSPLEVLNAQPSGHIVNNITKYVGNHPSDSAVPFSKKATSTNTVIAEWLPLNAGNRVTPPNLQKNERVMLLKYANVDKFYWIDKGFNTLRRLERVEYRFSDLKDWSRANKEEPDHANSSDNCYVFTVDTFKGTIHLSTSRSNSEITGYDILIDGKNGTFSIKDTQENMIVLKSDNGKLEISTKKDVSIVTSNRVYMKAAAIVADGELYVSGSINVMGDVRYGGDLMKRPKSPPAETTVSLTKEAEAATAAASGRDMTNSFARMLSAGTSLAGTGTTPAPAPAASPPTPSQPVSLALAETFRNTDYT